MPSSPVQTESLSRLLTPADLRWLACPACHKPLELSAGETSGDTVQCSACRRIYPIEDGLPVLLTGRATQTL